MVGRVSLAGVRALSRGLVLWRGVRAARWGVAVGWGVAWCGLLGRSRRCCCVRWFWGLVLRSGVLAGLWGGASVSSWRGVGYPETIPAFSLQYSR